MKDIREKLKKIISDSGLDYESLQKLVEDVYYQPDNEDDQTTLNNLRSQYLNKFVRWENYEAGSVIMYVEKIIFDEAMWIKFSGRAIVSLTENSTEGQGGFIYHDEFDYTVDDPEYDCPEIIDVPEVYKHVDGLIDGFKDYTLPEFTNIED